MPAQDPPSERPGIAARLITLMTRRRTIHRTLLTVLLVALAPLALLAAIQGITRLSLDARNANRALADTVTDMTRPDRNRLERLQPMVELLQLHGDAALESPEACAEVRRAVREGVPSYTTLVVADASGRIACSSNPTWVGNLLPPEGVVQGDALGLAGSALVMGPATAPAPGRESHVAAVVSLEGLVAVMGPPQRNKGAVTLLADGTGRILAGDAPPGWQRVPLNAPGTLVRVDDENEKQWVLVNSLLRETPNPASNILLLFARPSIAAFSKDWWFFVSSFALPLLALLLASLAIWKGAGHSILRWVAELRQTTERIAEGNYRLTGERFEDAPMEVRSLAADIQRMARALSERDRNLTEALHQQRELKLELNHRVRNNLQLISSFLTVQGTDARHKPDPLEQTRLRVAALSLVHRLLYTHYDRTALRADILLRELAGLLETACGMEGIRVEAPQIPVGVDAAVPIALGVVEAATWLQALGGPSAGLRALIFEAGEKEACLDMETDGLGDVSETDAPRLLTALTRQIGGRLNVLSDAQSPTRLQMCFPSDNLDRGFEANTGNKSRAR